jgi:imidazoleglycerol-phosphate dehydratase
LREKRIKRQTKETRIDLSLNIDGTGQVSIETGLPFLNHMLELLGKHASFDLTIEAKGDLEVDAHHTVEDVGIALGQSLRQALGDRRGIRRFGYGLIPMDEALAMVSVDISGRPYLSYDVQLPAEKLGTFDTDLFVDFLHAFVNHAAITLHIKSLSGRNAHHIIEAVFKGLAKSLQMAMEEKGGGVPSTKGKLD